MSEWTPELDRTIEAALKSLATNSTGRLSAWGLNLQTYRSYNPEHRAWWWRRVKDSDLETWRTLQVKVVTMQLTR